MAVAQLSQDDLVRVSTNAAGQFSNAYYDALNNARHTIQSFYVPEQTIPSGRTLPVITYNGTQSSNPAYFQSTFQSQMPFTYFDVQSLNAHVINPSVAQLDSQKGQPTKKDLEQNVSVMVQVSGSVRLVERKEGPLRAFSDTFVLLPNKEDVGAKGKAKSGEGRSWLIQSQNFRFVV